MKILSSFFIALVLAFNATSSDWPKWLGPDGNNIAPQAEKFEPDLTKWKEVWKADVGLGYSSLAVIDAPGGGLAYTMGHDGKGQETVHCLNASTGAPVWKYSYDGKLIAHLHTGGPNATPTIVGNKVITLSKEGQIFCFTRDKGEIVWKANLLDLFAIKLPEWGFASSAFVDGNHVIFCGGKTCALDLETGKKVWVSEKAYLPAGYATAPVFELDGNKFVAALDGKGFSILSAKDGSEIVRHPFKALFDMNATTPFILSGGKRIFISNTVKSDMLSFDGKALSPIWSGRELRNTMNNSVIQGGAIYGLSGEQEQTTNSLVCLNEADGKENWSQSNIGYGTTIAVGKTIVALTERGELISVKADPAKYTEISRRKIFEPVCWTTPTYALGKLYLRNDKGHVIVLGE